MLLVAHGVYLVIRPNADPDHWRYYTDEPDVVAYLADDFRASGGMEVAFGILTMVTAAGWLRRGDAWVWRAYWVFPALFVWSAFTTWAWPLFVVLAAAATWAMFAGRTARSPCGSETPLAASGT